MGEQSEDPNHTGGILATMRRVAHPKSLVEIHQNMNKNRERPVLGPMILLLILTRCVLAGLDPFDIVGELSKGC